MPDALELMWADAPDNDDINTAEMIEILQATMADEVGPIRDAAKLARALDRIDDLSAALGERPCGDRRAFSPKRLDWFDLRNMLLVARSIAEAALARTESRGSHQREDFPEMVPEWQLNQLTRLEGRKVRVSSGTHQAVMS